MKVSVMEQYDDMQRKVSFCDQVLCDVLICVVVEIGVQ